MPPGAVLGIVGANGMGKSTLVKLIVGAEEPDEGVSSASRQPSPARHPHCPPNACTWLTRASSIPALSGDSIGRHRRPRLRRPIALGA